MPCDTTVRLLARSDNNSVHQAFSLEKTDASLYGLGLQAVDLSDNQIHANGCMRLGRDCSKCSLGKRRMFLSFCLILIVGKILTFDLSNFYDSNRKGFNQANDQLYGNPRRSGFKSRLFRVIVNSGLLAMRSDGS